MSNCDARMTRDQGHGRQCHLCGETTDKGRSFESQGRAATGADRKAIARTIGRSADKNRSWSSAPLASRSSSPVVWRRFMHPPPWHHLGPIQIVTVVPAATLNAPVGRHSIECFILVLECVHLCASASILSFVSFAASANLSRLQTPDSRLQTWARGIRWKNFPFETFLRRESEEEGSLRRAQARVCMRAAEICCRGHSGTTVVAT